MVLSRSGAAEHLEVGTSGLDDLLDGLSGDLRGGRARLIRELLELGFDADELRRAHAQDRLAVLMLERALHESASLSAADVARACDLEVDDVLHANRLLGLTVDRDAFAFDELSCDALRTVRFAREFGLSDGALDELLIVLGRHMWQLAADMEVIVGNDLGREGDTEYELAHRWADAARALAPTAVPLVAGAFTAHLRRRMRDIFVTPQEAELGALRAIADVAVAFVDVVGFTRLGERVDGRELKSIAMRLAGVADAVIDPSVQLVKTIGDAILLTCRESTPLLDSLVKIHTGADLERGLPAIHSGIAYGPAYLGGADVYGAPVNLASRLTDLAPAGRIWASESVVADDTASLWTAHGRRHIEGCAEPIEVYELRP